MSSENILRITEIKTTATQRRTLPFRHGSDRIINHTPRHSSRSATKKDRKKRRWTFARPVHSFRSEEEDSRIYAVSSISVSPARNSATRRKIADRMRSGANRRDARRATLHFLPSHSLTVFTVWNELPDIGKEKRRLSSHECYDGT